MSFLLITLSLVGMLVGCGSGPRPSPEVSKTTPSEEFDDNLPSVSIVVPTYPARHMFHELLYQSFLQQNYPKKKLELLIFDNGDQPSLFFNSETRDRVRYHYVPGPISLGAKRNWLAENAKNDVIVSFDDDDFYGQNYVSFMVKSLDIENKVKLVKLTGWPMASFGPSGTRFQLDFVFPDFTQYGWGFSWVYRKGIFQDSSCRFADRNYAEEDPFSQCIASTFGEPSIKRIPASTKPFTVLKFENRARYIGDNSPLKWSQFHVDRKIAVTKNDYTEVDWRHVEQYFPLFRLQIKTNLSGLNRVPIPIGCEAGPCDAQPLRQAFIKEAGSAAAQAANIIIPRKPGEAIRVATYNVHEWKDINNGSNIAAIFDILESFHADVIGLQEVTLSPEAQNALMAYKAKTGMKDAFCKADTWPGAPFGNLLLTSYDMTDINKIDLPQYQEGRCAVMAVIDTPLGRLNIGTVHLDAFDTTGATRIK
ncbi:MAG TPA: glycosyltransferase, partial [Myxococcota bacterium]|nr:glycosyltransferase [Myxococcota bacterium]